jgi:hypothetical protein
VPGASELEGSGLMPWVRADHRTKLSDLMRWRVWRLKVFCGLGWLLLYFYFQPSDWLASFWFMFNLLTSRVFGVDFSGKFSVGRNYPPSIEGVHTMAAFLFACLAWYMFVTGLRRETHRNGL